MDPFTGSLILGGLNAGMGILGASASQNARQQQYLNDITYQKANSEFARWQAGFNARVNNANSQYKYWVDTVNFNQERAYVNSQRNVELLKGIRQAESVMEARAAAGAAYVSDSEAITAAFAEAEMQQAVAMQQYRWRALQARASVQARATEGKSVDRLVNDYARQEGDYVALQQINSGIRSRQFSRQQAGQLMQYLNRWESQQFYDEQTYFEPAAPFAPLPTLISPAPPSRTGAAPSSSSMWLDVGTSLMGGVQTGLGIYGQLKGLQTPSSKQGPGTPRGGY